MNSPDRLPPHNIEVERSLIGGILRDPDVFHDAQAIVNADCFYTDAHQRIFRALAAIVQSPEPLTLESLHRKIGHEADDTGGAAYLADLWDSCATGANVIYHAKIVRECATVRNLIHAGNEILRDCYDRTSSAEELLALAERKIHAISCAAQGSSLNAVPIGPVMRQVLEDLDARVTAGGTTVGLLTGYTDLDAKLGGLRPGDLIVIGARPSAGKTAGAINILANLACTGIPGLIASLEMRKEELAERLLAMGSGVSMHALSKPRDLSDKDRGDLTYAASTDSLGGAPLFVDDEAQQTPAHIASVARRAVQKHGVQILAVDFLQMMSSEGRQEDRRLQVGNFALRMKMVARELGIPVLLLSQLNRESESNGGRRPKMSDLYESGAIEQYADKIVLLHRDPQECQEADPVWPIDVIVAKNRNGPIGDVRLAYRRPVMRFENASHGF